MGLFLNTLHILFQSGFLGFDQFLYAGTAGSHFLHRRSIREVFKDLPLASGSFEEVFIDTSFRHQPVDEDIVYLTHAVGSADCLIFC